MSVKIGQDVVAFIGGENVEGKIVYIIEPNSDDPTYCFFGQDILRHVKKGDLNADKQLCLFPPIAS